MAVSLMQLSQLFGGGPREGCFFESKVVSVDLSAVCHEVRGVELSEGEQIFISAQDMRHADDEQSGALGTACHLKAVGFDTTLLLRVWAGQRLGGRPATTAGGRCRPCGELQIPLGRLLGGCDGMMYQTWATLERPGGAGDDGASFDERLADGALQLSQLRVCLSVCKTSELGPHGRLLLAADAQPEARIENWGALLRSQQQHAMMSSALHNMQMQMQSCQASENSPQKAAARREGQTQAQFQKLEEHVQAQAKEVEELRHQLREAQGSPSSGGPSSRRGMAAGVHAEQIRISNASKRSEIEALRSELSKLSGEANSKIDQANERIRELKCDRDEARGEAQRMQIEGKRVATETRGIEEEMQLLHDQKEALLGIVEDLHNSCVGAGLHSAGRQSIDNTLAGFKVH